MLDELELKWQKNRFEERQLPLLKKLKPFPGGIRNGKTPKEYLELYFQKGMPRTVTMDNEFQCGSGRRRSFLDLYYLCKAKFKDITMEEFAYNYINVSNGFSYTDKNGEINNKKLFIIFCITVNKFVCRPNKSRYVTSLFVKKRKYFYKSKNRIDEDLTYKAIDGISIQDIINLANKWIKMNKL